MPLTLYNNIDALSALFNLNQINSAISLSTQRLSSGLRVASPADDPTGYTIANNFQVQVDSLNQALSNTQTNISLVKTATGALSQFSGVLSSIRASALDAAANSTINPAAAQADQLSIQLALQTLTSLAATTQFGSKNLLDGTAGVTAAITNGTNVGGVSFGGNYAGGATQSGNVSITVVNAATAAQAIGGSAATYASVNASLSTVNGGTTGSGGSVVINGQSISVTGTDTVQTLINKINAVSNTTGVTAGATTANGSTSITLNQTTYGGNFKITESESSALIVGTAGTTVAGLNATVAVTAPALLNGQVTSVLQTFVGGRGTTDSGLRVTDTYGNSILLTQAGNVVNTNGNVGSLSSNPLQFQIGANPGQSATVSFSSLFPSALGTTSVPGQSLSTINVTTQSGANNALTIVNEAINQVNTLQTTLGSFQNNVLQVTQNVLNSSIQNISASIASIRNVNIAQETVSLSNNQLIQQAGISALAVLRNNASYYLKLLA